MLRVAIPVAIALILGATVLVSWLDPLKVLARLPIDSGKLVISGTKITMEAPKLSGYTRDQRWYEMNAKSAAQDVTKPDVVELAEVRAKIETADKSTILLSAKDGLYNRKTSMLNLNRNIVVKSSSRLRDASRRSRRRHRQRRGRVRTSRSRCSRRTPRSMPIGLKSRSPAMIVRFIGSVVMNLNGARQAANSRRRSR